MPVLRMPVLYMMEFRDGRQEQYDEAMRLLGLDQPGASWPIGLLSHVAGPGAEGWCVTDMWESEEDFERFLRERLGGVIARLGLAQPGVQCVPLYNVHVENARARRLLDDVYAIVNSGDVTNAPRFISEDYVDHSSLGELHGAEGFAMIVNTYRTAFPDLHCEIRDVVSVGRDMAWRTIATGTHQGDFLGIPPTGRAVRIEGLDRGRVGDDGRAVEHRSMIDLVSVLVQIGAMAGPATDIPAQADRTAPKAPTRST